MRDLVVVTDHSEHNRAVFELSESNHSKYCERYGYDMYNTIGKYSAGIDWDKVDFLGCRYKYIAFVGTDIFFTDLNKPLLSMLGSNFITCSYELQPGKIINGDFLVFNTEHKDADKFLSMLRTEDSRRHHSQDSINALKNNNPTLISTVDRLQVAAKEMNDAKYAPVLWHPGDFSIHFNRYWGAPNVENKIKAMTQFRANHPEYF